MTSRISSANLAPRLRWSRRRHKAGMSGEDKRAQRACRIRRHGRGRVRTAGIRGDRRADGPAGREPRVPDGQRHAEPRNRRDREHPPRARAALRRHLRCDAAAHAARGGDRRRRTGPRRRGRPHRHGRRRLDHRRRQGGAALPRQRHPQPSTTSTGSGPVAAPRRSSTAPPVRQISVPTTIAGGEFSRHRRRHQREDQGQGSAAPSAADAARRRSSIPAHRAHAGMAVAVDRHPRRRPLRRGHLLARGPPLRRRPGAERACRCWRRRCRG